MIATLVFLYQASSECWSLAGSQMLDIIELRVGNHCCCELGGHITALQLQPSLPQLVGLATSQMSNLWLHEGGIRDGGSSWTHIQWVSPSLIDV